MQKVTAAKMPQMTPQAVKPPDKASPLMQIDPTKAQATDTSLIHVSFSRNKIGEHKMTRAGAQ